jgi:hypothetical protein
MIMRKTPEQGHWPMTWSAYAKGVLLAFALPLLIVILIALRAH